MVKNVIFLAVFLFGYTVQAITGVAGNVQYPGLWKQHSLDEYVAPQPETDNYMTLEATDDSLTFRSFLPDGQLLEEKSISSHK